MSGKRGKTRQRARSDKGRDFKDGRVEGGLLSGTHDIDGGQENRPHPLGIGSHEKDLREKLTFNATFLGLAVEKKRKTQKHVQFGPSASESQARA